MLHHVTKISYSRGVVGSQGGGGKGCELDETLGQHDGLGG